MIALTIMVFFIGVGCGCSIRYYSSNNKGQTIINHMIPLREQSYVRKVAQLENKLKIAKELNEQKDKLIQSLLAKEEHGD